MVRRKYLADANILMYFEFGERYDKNCFPNHYNNFTQLIEKGVVISLDAVKEEVSETEEGKEFCDKYTYMFKPNLTNDDIFKKKYNYIKKLIPDYFKVYDKKSSADSTLIVYAYTYNLCIITQEELQKNRPKKDHKLKIPTIVKLLGGYCIDNGYNKKNAGKSYDGFGCINFSELTRKEKLYECHNK